MEIKILGTGCKKCKQLEETVRHVVTQMEIDANVTKVEDIPVIMQYGVLNTPALVINEKVKSTGRLLKESEVLQFIKEELA